MPVPQSIKDKIKSDSEKAKALLIDGQQESKQQTAQEAVFLRQAVSKVDQLK